MSRPSAVISRHQPEIATRRIYVVGFVLSLTLTLAAYAVVTRHWLEGRPLIGGLIGLALLQFAVQLICFLHLAHEPRPRWKLVVFGFMFMVVIILAVGSIWIMNNLNYNTMSPPELRHYLHTEEGI